MRFRSGFSCAGIISASFVKLDKRVAQQPFCWKYEMLRENSDYCESVQSASDNAPSLFLNYCVAHQCETKDALKSPRLWDALPDHRRISGTKDHTAGRLRGLVF